jgi:hypothetical protein
MESESLPISWATHQKHGFSRLWRRSTGDINKVIHRNSGFVQKTPSNQRLADQTA